MSSSPAINLCFNSNCKRILDTLSLSKGWRRRNGDFTDLCHPCASVFEEGIFCETFHINASGWRCCESCGKQIHCGCIVSFHMFVLLDAGGIECITCARKSFILTPNPAWPPPSLPLPPHSERMNDISSKNWCHIAGSGPVPWQQAPSYFGSSSFQPDLWPRMPMEVDVTGGINRLTSSKKLSVSSFDKKKVEVSERLINGSLKLLASEKHDVGNPGINFADQATLHVNVPHLPSILEKETQCPQTFPFYSVTRDVLKDPTVVSSTHVPQSISPNLNGKHCSGQGETESCGEIHTCNGMPSRDTGMLNQTLRRYWPRTSDHELQQLHGTSKSIITPLFEKKLSVSDTRNIGRLVLPKKCAEAYFPPITTPEGLPLNVQDLKGKEWTFQFRFWTNNKSRMYVLEGVNHCIQSMNLQAGDVVTFNLVEPEGKLVMGFRKVSTTSPSYQDVGYVHASNTSSTDGDDSANNSKSQASSPCKNRKAVCEVQKVARAKATMSNKRKNSILGSKYKCFRMEKNDPIEMELTWEQAQGLLRPPLNRIPHVVVIEGFEFEEFEDAPVIGRPTIIATDGMGENIQWAQCEDCLKWRKVPGDASLSSRWTCSGNSWDPERSSCSMAQELTEKQVKELLPRCNQTASKNTSDVKQEPESSLDLDGLVGLCLPGIQEEGDANPSSSHAAIKHPRHGPHCTCIICIQPPKGECPSHVDTCTCNLCLALKKRLGTLMSRREKKRSEREAEGLGKNLTDHQSCSTLNPIMGNGRIDNFNTTMSYFSPFKGPIDLNFQPERDEEQSFGSDSGDLTKLIRNTTESSNGSVMNGNFRSGNRNNFIISHFEPKDLKCRGTQR